ncbi:putative rna recognition domain-containing protein [Golovinomyces cichoracearum]|uniref:Putative rna recognition domain-containing protein n=1 Tax=Golovinomyces cichoracearum TaxID=62708 RepID=A0A420IV91_9PEZI|nr:putative rna recognition domain-containing protein [Golovinomyces cichoracearum]
MPIKSPSPARGRPRAKSDNSTKGRSPSRSLSKHRRSITPRSASRSPKRSSRYKSESRSHTRSRSRSRSHSRSRSRSRNRSLSHGRSLSPPRSTKIVVEKLTKNITADHLREIFSTYGNIRDLDMPMNRQFDFNRGTAYILYSAEVDAEAAIAHMHESQIDGSVINVSIVLPRRKFSPSPPPAKRSANIDARPPPSNFRNGPPPSRRRSPAPTYSRSDRNFDTYRPSAISRSRSPPSRRYRTISRSPSSPSRTPPRRRGTRRSSVDRNTNSRRRRSPSYSSYSSYDDRGRSRSRDRGSYRRR